MYTVENWSGAHLSAVVFIAFKALEELLAAQFLHDGRLSVNMIQNESLIGLLKGSVHETVFRREWIGCFSDCEQGIFVIIDVLQRSLSFDCGSWHETPGIQSLCQQ